MSVAVTKKSAFINGNIKGNIVNQLNGGTNIREVLLRLKS